MLNSIEGVLIMSRFVGILMEEIFRYSIAGDFSRSIFVEEDIGCAGPRSG